LEFNTKAFSHLGRYLKPKPKASNFSSKDHTPHHASYFLLIFSVLLFSSKACLSANLSILFLKYILHIYSYPGVTSWYFREYSKNRASSVLDREMCSRGWWIDGSMHKPVTNPVHNERPENPLKPNSGPLSATSPWLRIELGDLKSTPEDLESSLYGNSWAFSIALWDRFNLAP
jgi:hypothetical protein